MIRPTSRKLFERAKPRMTRRVGLVYVNMADIHGDKNKALKLMDNGIDESATTTDFPISL